MKGLLKTVSVYRLFGSGVTEKIDDASISAINAISKEGSGPTSDFSSNSHSFSGSLSYRLNTANII